ncbi:MAG: flagellar hook-length control protein FliK [Paracoccaceae bacterium]|nr:flagellar hook-length control protein FliK [Paracoccaceae bacterium]
MEPKSVTTAVSSVLSIASGTGAPDVGGSTEVDFAKVISAKQGGAEKQPDQQQGKRLSNDAPGQKLAAGNDDTPIMSADPLALKIFKPKIDTKFLEVVGEGDANAALLLGVPGQGDIALSENALATDAILEGQDAVLAHAAGADAMLATAGEKTVVTVAQMVVDDAPALPETVVATLSTSGKEGDNEDVSDKVQNVQVSGEPSQTTQDEASQSAALFTMDTDAAILAGEPALQSSLKLVDAGPEAAGTTATAAAQQATVSATLENTGGKGSTDGTITQVTGESVAILQDLDPDGSDTGAKSVAAPVIASQGSDAPSLQNESVAKIDKIISPSQGSAEQNHPQPGASDTLAKSGLTKFVGLSEVIGKTTEANPETTKSQAVVAEPKLDAAVRATVASSSNEIKTTAAESKTDKTMELSLADAKTTDVKSSDDKVVKSIEKGATLVAVEPADANSSEAKLADIKAMDAKALSTKGGENTAGKSPISQGAESKETAARSHHGDKVALSDTPQKVLTKETEISPGKKDLNLAPEKLSANAKRDMTTALQKLVTAETAKVDAAVRPAAKLSVTPVSAAQTAVIKQSTETVAQITPVQTEITKQMRRNKESAASVRKAAIEGLDGKLKDLTVESTLQKSTPIVDRPARKIALESATPVAAEDNKAASEMMAPVNAGSGKPQANLAVSSNTTTPAQNLAGLERWSNSIVDVQKQGWTQSLVRRVAAMPTNGSRLVITLQPASLGKISVSMAEGRRGMDIRMRTETSATAALLNDAESRISQLLLSSGMQLNSFSADTSGSFAENENSSDESDSSDQSNGQKSAHSVQELPENAEQSIAQKGDGLVNLIA